ncbi:MAG: WecB/TagA/CpsF family glycosyltransferase, partial [Actinomycetota bacterium]|nr:WecB/TagA/CpsF family glycosyltransferase [Actinomycetota bacterium]
MDAGTDIVVTGAVRGGDTSHAPVVTRTAAAEARRIALAGDTQGDAKRRLRSSAEYDEIPRFDVLDIHVSAASMTTALDQIERWIERRERRYVCVSDVNGVVTAHADPDLRGVYNRSGMTLPDGVPLVWSGRRAGFRDMTRVCGPDLMPALLSLAAERGWSSYFYGGAPGVAERLVENFDAQIVGLLVAGVASPPYRPLSAEETAAAIAAINDSGADIVWV